MKNKSFMYLSSSNKDWPRKCYPERFRKFVAVDDPNISKELNKFVLNNKERNLEDQENDNV